MIKGAEKVVSTVRHYVENNFPYEVFDVTFSMVERRKVLEVFIDLPKGVTVTDCETVSRGLSKYLDEADLIEGEYTLEVSSPGVERVFKRQVDYERHIDKLVKWTLKDPGTGKKKVFEGRLKEFSPDCIKVQTGKELREFSLNTVIEAQAVFEFPEKLKA